MKKQLTVIFTLLTLFMLIILGGCTDNEKADTHNFKVGTWKTAQTIQPYFFDSYLAEGDTIEVLAFTNPGDQKAALLAGDLDLCGTTWVTAIIAAANGEPIKVVGSMTNKCSALVVGADSGIETPADLKGKTIAYVPGTMHHILLLETLSKAGLDAEKDVQLQRIDFFDMGQALATNQIDAFCSGEPYPSIALTEGYGKILEYPYYDESIGFINAAIITTKAKINDNPDGLQSLVSAHIQATEYLEQNQEEWLAKAAEFGTDVQVLQQSAQNIDLSWEITPTMIEQVKNLAQQMLKMSIINTMPDIDALIDLRFIEDTELV